MTDPRAKLAEALTLLSALTAAARAQPLEVLDGPDLDWGTTPLAVSADGAWIAGLSWSNLEHQAVRWFGAGPRQVLSDFVFSGADVRYVSNDGRVWGELDGSAGAWTSTDFVPLCDGYSRVGAPTPDGGMVIARCPLPGGAGEGAFIYAGTTEVRRLLSDDRRNTLSCPGLSADGAVGLLQINIHNPQPPAIFNQPALWTPSGVVDLPTADAYYAEGRCLSASGRVAGGALSTFDGQFPVIWIDAGSPIIVGPQDLRVEDLSADGRVALTRRGLWSPATGLREFADLLLDAGVDPAEAAGVRPVAMSDDATVFAGYRARPGRTQPLRITLPPPCSLDYATDGFVDFFDYLAYVDCFLGDCPNYRSADFNFDGFVDWTDYADFVDAFEIGC